MPPASPEEKLIPSVFLFSSAVPCHYPSAVVDGARCGTRRCVSHRQPGEPPRRQQGFADVRVAWSEAGLAVSCRVEGKRQPAWCRAERVEDSDGLIVLLDTRDTRDVHLAGRFCHQFRFLPAGGGSPVRRAAGGAPAAIDRARELPRPIDAATLRVQGRLSAAGYLVEGFLPAKALTGFDPVEHPRLGFQFAVVDREKGIRPFTVGGEFPVSERSEPGHAGTGKVKDRNGCPVRAVLVSRRRRAAARR